MKVLIAGSRDFKVSHRVVIPLVQAVVNDLPEGATVITGGAQGVDLWAEGFAHARGLSVVTVRPDWDKHGKAAGPIRNRQMVEMADKVYCFWDGESRGTKSTIDAARAADKLEALVTLKPNE